MFTVVMDVRGDDVKLTLSGDVDYSVRRQLEPVLRWVLDGLPDRLTVDVDGVEIIDCGTIGLLVGARWHLGLTGGRLTITNPRGKVSRLLCAVGLYERLVGPPPGVAAA